MRASLIGAALAVALGGAAHAQGVSWAQIDPSGCISNHALFAQGVTPSAPWVPEGGGQAACVPPAGPASPTAAALGPQLVPSGGGFALQYPDGSASAVMPASQVAAALTSTFDGAGAAATEASRAQAAEGTLAPKSSALAAANVSGTNLIPQTVAGATLPPQPLPINAMDIHNTYRVAAVNGGTFSVPANMSIAQLLGSGVVLAATVVLPPAPVMNQFCRVAAIGGLSVTTLTVRDALGNAVGATLSLSTLGNSPLYEFNGTTWDRIS